MRRPCQDEEILRACASQNILNCLSVIRHGSKNMYSDDAPIVVICEGYIFQINYTAMDLMIDKQRTTYMRIALGIAGIFEDDMKVETIWRIYEELALKKVIWHFEM